MFQDFSRFDSTDSRPSRFSYTGLLLGAATGITAGLLLAPSRGREARAYLRDRTGSGRQAVASAWTWTRNRLRRRPASPGGGMRMNGREALAGVTDQTTASAVLDRAVAELAHGSGW